MSRVIETIDTQLLSASAANADRLGDLSRDPRPDVPAAAVLGETASGWDSYEVWRRFIKDARDRRQADLKS
jgi:hypothetical protein